MFDFIFFLVVVATGLTICFGSPFLINGGYLQRRRQSVELIGKLLFSPGWQRTDSWLLHDSGVRIQLTRDSKVSSVYLDQYRTLETSIAEDKWLSRQLKKSRPEIVTTQDDRMTLELCDRIQKHFKKD
jgi:hypothetical protein